MFNKLSNILNSKEAYISENIISNVDDLMMDNKINFYYLLLKYILKNNIILYKQIPHLKIRNLVKFKEKESNNN